MNCAAVNCAAVNYVAAVGFQVILEPMVGNLVMV